MKRLSLKAGPAWPTSLKTVLARPKIRPGQEDVKSRVQWPRMFILCRSKATGVDYYVIMSACAVALSMHQTCQLGLPQ